MGMCTMCVTVNKRFYFTHPTEKVLLYCNKTLLQSNFHWIDNKCCFIIQYSIVTVVINANTLFT